MVTNISEFSKSLMGALQEKLGEDIVITEQEQLKNNGCIYHGLILRKNSERISPVIYIDEYYNPFTAGNTTLEEIVNDIIKKFESSDLAVLGDFSVDDVLEFDKIKDKIVFGLINTESNKEFLANAPHREWNDLSMILFVALECEGSENAMIKVQDKLLKQWGIDTEEKVDALFEFAKINTQQTRPSDVMHISEIVKEMMIKQGMPQETIEDFETYSADSDGVPMFVCSNKMRHMGASVMLYDSIFAMLSSSLEGGDLYIIPSSIHEVIAIPAKNIRLEAHDLTEMIASVNTTSVLENEVLSNNLYMYIADEDKIIMVDKEGI